MAVREGGLAREASEGKVSGGLMKHMASDNDEKLGLAAAMTLKYPVLHVYDLNMSKSIYGRVF